MPFVQSCVLCGDHKRLMHDPHLTPCPTCGSPYCKSCYSSLPKIKTGLLRKQPQCPRCAQGSQVARAPYAPYSMQPVYTPVSAPSPQPPYSPALQTPQIREKEIITREIVKIKCRSEEHTSELQSQSNLVCRLLLEKKKTRHKHEPYRTRSDTTTPP